MLFRSALRVDEVTEAHQEIVIKTIGPQLSRIPGIAGATVLPNGEVVLILNPVQLAARPEEESVVVNAVSDDTGLPPMVMVVDDSLTVRKITGRLLERQGYRVVTARDGEEAMQQLAEQLPQVMLVDVEIPRMDGFELTRRVRGDEHLKDIPIIMISSDRKSTRLNSSHSQQSRMPSSA